MKPTVIECPLQMTDLSQDPDFINTFEKAARALSKARFSAMNIAAQFLADRCTACGMDASGVMQHCRVEVQDDVRTYFVGDQPVVRYWTEINDKVVRFHVEPIVEVGD